MLNEITADAPRTFSTMLGERAPVDFDGYSDRF